MSGCGFGNLSKSHASKAVESGLEPRQSGSKAFMLPARRITSLQNEVILFSHYLFSFLGSEPAPRKNLNRLDSVSGFKLPLAPQ